jgi:hypothetical protein
MMQAPKIIHISSVCFPINIQFDDRSYRSSQMETSSEDGSQEAPSTTPAVVAWLESLTVVDMSRWIAC